MNPGSTEGDDQLEGTEAADALCAYSGNDQIVALGGNESSTQEPATTPWTQETHGLLPVLPSCLDDRLLKEDDDLVLGVVDRELGFDDIDDFLQPRHLCDCPPEEVFDDLWRHERQSLIRDHLEDPSDRGQRGPELVGDLLTIHSSLSGDGVQSF